MALLDAIWKSMLTYFEEMMIVPCYVHVAEFEKIIHNSIAPKPVRYKTQALANASKSTSQKFPCAT